MDFKQKFSFIRPEFFDSFGFFVWIFFIIIGFRALNGYGFPNWAIITLLLISVTGLIIDGTIVIKTYLWKK